MDSTRPPWAYPEVDSGTRSPPTKPGVTDARLHFTGFVFTKSKQKFIFNLLKSFPCFRVQPEINRQKKSDDCTAFAGWSRRTGNFPALDGIIMNESCIAGFFVCLTASSGRELFSLSRRESRKRREPSSVYSSKDCIPHAGGMQSFFYFATGLFHRPPHRTPTGIQGQKEMHEAVTLSFSENGMAIFVFRQNRPSRHARADLIQESGASLKTPAQARIRKNDVPQQRC